MSIKRLGPKLYQVRVQFRDPKTKRKRSLEKTVNGTERDARRAERELAAVRDQGGRRKAQTLRAFAKSWLRTRLPTLKPSVAKKYATSLDLHIGPALGDYLLDKIAPSDVQDYVNERVAAGAAGNTVLNELRLLRVLARDSVAEGAAPRNWADRVKAPPVASYTEEAPNLLQPAELAQLLAVVPRRWLALVTLIGFTGLRWGEASALRWEDLDVELGIIRIRRSNWKGKTTAPKTAGSARSVGLPAPFVALVAATPKSKRRGWLFPTMEGELHRGTPLRAILERACKKAGVPRVTAHGLRRTFNNLARQKASREVVKSVTGHATDAMLEHYSLVGADEKRQLTEAVIDAVKPLLSAPEEIGSGSGEYEGEDW